jgi:hypothetical protein
MIWHLGLVHDNDKDNNKNDYNNRILGRFLTEGESPIRPPHNNRDNNNSIYDL